MGCCHQDQNGKTHKHGPSMQMIVIIVVLGCLGFYLFTEHKAHLYGALPWLILLLCPLMHIFMHGSHGDHKKHKDE